MMRARTALIAALSACILLGGLSSGTSAATTPTKYFATVTVDATLSPTGDVIVFSGKVTSKLRDCTLRSVEIRRPSTGRLIFTTGSSRPVKTGTVWTASYQTDRLPVPQNGFTEGETIKVLIRARPTKKGDVTVGKCVSATAEETVHVS